MDAPTPWSVHECGLTDGATEFHLVDANDHTLLRQRDVNGRHGKCAIDFLQRLADNANATSSEVMALARIVHQQDQMGVSQSSKRHHASSLLALHMVGVK